MTYAIIMAGGSGTRFWPASRANKPKQFLDLFGGGTMIQHTIRRIAPLVPAERVFVITNRDFVHLVREQVPEVPAENIIGEPVAKNTAPCIALGAALIGKRDPDATLLVLPSDHTISDEAGFRNVLSTAVQKASSGNFLVTIGIRPNRPETGYGYIQLNRSSAEKGLHESVYSVARFAEKPSLETAQQFLASGDFLWNSGMFVWKASSILNAFSAFLPEMRQLAETAIGVSGSAASIDQFFHAATSISIDYGIMEKSSNVFVIPGDFGWNDVGSWTAVHELAEKDAHGNAHLAPFTMVDDAKNSLISSRSGKLIALVGLDDVAIVETDDAILVTSLKKAQQVKNITNALSGKFAPFK